jgi:hypothetical protein
LGEWFLDKVAGGGCGGGVRLGGLVPTSRTLHIGEEKSLCSGQSCECVNYLKSVHSGNVDPVSTTVKALVLTGLSLIIVGVGAGVYGLYCQVW